MKHLTKNILLLLCLSCWQLIFAQNELGLPYIKYYSPKEYKGSGTIWEIDQGKNGLMYFGNAEGIIEYDGIEWRKYSVDNQSTVRSIDVDDKGIVYLGAKSEFGYLSSDSLGKTFYQNLSSKIQDTTIKFSDVWNTYATKQGVFFLTFNVTFRWYEDSLYIYKHTDDNLNAHLGFHVNNRLYVIFRKSGLHYFNGDQFAPCINGDFFVNKPIFTILPFKADTILIGTRTDGLLLYNTSNGNISPFKIKDADFPKNDKLYHGSRVRDFLVFGTLANGVYVYNLKGELIYHLDQENGLHINNIKHTFIDYYNGLWLATANGIYYVDVTLPLTFFSQEYGYQGVVRSIIRHNGIIYIATGNGVFKLDNTINSKKKFVKINNTDDQFWTFLEMDGMLLAGSSNGLFKIENNNSQKISKQGFAVFYLHRSSFNRSIFYAATKNGVAIGKVEDGKLKYFINSKEVTVDCEKISQDRFGNLWVKTAFRYLIKINKPEFDDNGFPLPLKAKKIQLEKELAVEGFYNIKNHLLFPGEDSLFMLDNNQKFVAQNILPLNNFPSQYKIHKIFEDKKERLWIHYHSDNGESGEILGIKERKSYSFKERTLNRVNEKLIHPSSFYLDDDVAWYGSGDGIVRYDVNKDYFEEKSYNVNIRKISLLPDSIIYFGNDRLLDFDKFVFNYKNNGAKFIVSAANYSNIQETKYQYFLEGYDSDWSEWTYNNEKEYSFLPEGNYVFHVRAKNIYNQLSKEERFKFSILPPWYKKPWAYIAAVLLLILIIYLIIRIATYRLIKSKKKLERIIEERTIDIRKEKEVVEHQKILLEQVHNELSIKNKDMVDSIKYAQRIQSSIMPDKSLLTEIFPESFIFYKAKDIVSGDFYWFQKYPDYFIAAVVDCTGHGVPGAFMSLIGSTLLNKIVELKEVDAPQKALSILDKELVKTLHAESNEYSKDGMDASLIVFNFKTNVLQFAGANHSLYFIRDNELQTFKGSRVSIGTNYDDSEKLIEGHEIKLKKGDAFYMMTDGYIDQFGGPKNKKFLKKRLKELLLTIYEKPMKEQLNILQEAFVNWMGDNEQTDDVLIMGIKI